MSTFDYLALRADLPTLGAIVGTGWFFWQRYQALEKRLDQIERYGLQQDAKHQLSRQATQATLDRLEYLVGANRQLIDDRTKRLETAISRLCETLTPSKINP